MLYTVNQVENIYWALVSSYEDLQAKERALEQSKKVAADDRKQLEIGTMAPLDVVTADSSVAADQQSLISSQSALNYQQQIIKQAIARNLNDPELAKAPVIPTDRVSLEELPEEKQPTEELVQEAFKQRPELEQAVLTLKNDEITVKGARNALLPTVIDLVRLPRWIGALLEPSGSANSPVRPGLLGSHDCAEVSHWGLWNGARLCVQQPVS